MIEPEDLKEKISEIENCEFQKIRRTIKFEPFELKPDNKLISDLSGGYGALFVRSVFQKLNLDERRIFKWRLENKFEQYQVLNHYIPDCMPNTLSLSGLLRQSDGIEKIKKLFAEGFFLKQTLGDATFFTNNWDKTLEFDNIYKSYLDHFDIYESYMLQKKMFLKSEYRVHTFCKEIIPGLIYKMKGEKLSDNFSGLESFLKMILKKLPAVILEGTMIGWDIGLTSNDEYYVIEANFTGFHPEYRTGFQTTGYVDGYDSGPIICAWLNIYFKNNFRVYIKSIERSLLDNNKFYMEFMFYASILKKEHLKLSWDKTENNSVSIIYWVGYINSLLVSLINYLQLVNLTEFYCVITGEDRLKDTMNLFEKNTQIKVLAENSLYTKNEYQSVQKLNYARRKRISCDHALHQINHQQYLII